MLHFDRPGEAVDLGEAEDVRERKQCEYEHQGAGIFTVRQKRVDVAGDGCNFFIFSNLFKVHLGLFEAGGLMHQWAVAVS